MSKDLLVCVRCHTKPTFILDTVDSVKWSCGGDTTEVVLAVDAVENLATKLRTVMGKKNVYCSPKKWGWGAGLFCLLVESIVYFEKRFDFSHFLSIDYDTLFIRKNVDLELLSFVDSPSVGLVGNYSATNNTWAERFNKERKTLEQVFGRVPVSFIPGEGIQGGCMLLTKSLIEVMRNRGMFRPPFSEAKNHTGIADDHLLPMFVRMCGLDLVDSGAVTRCQWKATSDPRGLEKRGICVFHPTKLKPGPVGSDIAEKQIRNYFRRIRKQAPI